MWFAIYQFTNRSVWQLQKVCASLVEAETEAGIIKRVLVILGEDREDAEKQVSIKVFSENAIPTLLERVE